MKSLTEKTTTLGRLAEELGGELKGPADLSIAGVSPLHPGSPGHIAYLSDPKKIGEAEESACAALLVPLQAKLEKKPGIAVKNVKLAFARTLAIFHPRQAQAPGIHSTAVVASSASVAKTSSVGPYAVIGERAKIGERVLIGPFALIEDEVEVGDDSVIRPRASLLARVRVGKRCVINDGAVIGREGFGYATDDEGRHHHVPQVGTVILEDDVEIGVNTGIDRATMGETRLKRGVKIDSLVQVAHNVQIGENSLVAAQVGLAGSVTIGAGCILAGHSGVVDHVSVGDKAILGGSAKVWRTIKPGEMVSGDPARPHREQLKARALLAKLPELVRRIEALEQQQ